MDHFERSKEIYNRYIQSDAYAREMETEWLRKQEREARPSRPPPPVSNERERPNDALQSFAKSMAWVLGGLGAVGGYGIFAQDPALTAQFPPAAWAVLGFGVGALVGYVGVFLIVVLLRIAIVVGAGAFALWGLTQLVQL